MEEGTLAPATCSCIGHKMPGIRHSVRCCDQTHVDEVKEDVSFIITPTVVEVVQSCVIPGPVGTGRYIYLDLLNNGEVRWRPYES